MPGYRRLPAGSQRPPCVILLGGLDTTKEDYQVVNDLCVERGLATLAFDGPGQGETLFRMPWAATSSA
jgi:2,6-dihydroxypseudooxynicotine hydrolase